MTARRKPLVAMLTLASVLLAGGACSSDPADAARVGDAHVTRAAFDAEVNELLANDAFRQVLVDQELEGSTEGPAPRFVATWLTRWVRDLALEAEFRARDLVVTERHRQRSRAALERAFGGEKVFSSFSPSLQRAIVERNARDLAVGLAVTPEGDGPSDADALAYYEANAGTCQLARSVSHILVKTSAEAEEVQRELAGGADFAALAAERSIDTTTAQEGGELGCVVHDTFVPEFQQAAEEAPLDVPVGPVETTFGFHVILATDYLAPTFEEARDEILDRLRSQLRASEAQLRQADIDDVLEPRLAVGEVEVAKRYGTWVVDGDGARVVPPAGSVVTTSTTSPDEHDDG